MDIEEFRRRLDEALALGNVPTPARRAVEALEAARGPDRLVLLAWLHDAIEKHLERLRSPARAALRRSIEALRLTDDLEETYWTRLCQLLEPVPAVDPGVVSALFFLTGPSSLAHGIVAELVVTAARYGGGIRLVHHDARAGSLYTGFWAGCAAAQRYLIRRLAQPGGSGLIESLIYNRHLLGRLPALPEPDGESLGLAAALAALSAVLDLPIAPTVACTGRVEITGRLRAVDGLREKASAAVDAGIETLLVPADGAPTGSLGLRAIPCETLDDAVEHAFDAEALDRALSRLARDRLVSMPARDWRTAPDDRPRALFTMVGRSDPIGTYKDQKGKSLPESEDGPILSACRELQPSRVFLFYTTAKGNDMSPNAAEVEAFIARQWPCDVKRMPFGPEVVDPTDIEVVYHALAASVKKLQSDEDVFGRHACYVNMSSGTGQMQFVWALLTITRQLPATLVQARETRYVQPGEARIRRVELPSVVL